MCSCANRDLVLKLYSLGEGLLLLLFGWDGRRADETKIRLYNYFWLGWPGCNIRNKQISVNITKHYLNVHCAMRICIGWILPLEAFFARMVEMW